MKWGLTKKVETKNVKYEDKGWVYIRYFWKQVYKLFEDISPDVLKENLKTADYIEKAMDEGNEVAKKYFKGEVDIKELKKALEKCYQAWLKLYNSIKHLENKKSP